MVAIGGNLMMLYVEGDKHRHVSPDAYVTFGVPKHPERLNYIVWEEGKVPDVVIEITSKTRRKEDQAVKPVLYRDVLKIPEYYMFDPKEEYLKPSFQGYRLVDGVYLPVEVVDGRFRSEILGLDLDREGETLRLVDTATGERLLSPTEQAAKARERAESLEAENERLRREIEALRRGRNGEA